MEDFNETETGGKNEKAGEEETKDNKQWIRRLRKLHPSSLLWFISLNSIGNGFYSLRAPCIQNIFKEEFKVEPSELQLLTSLMAVPILFRMFFGIIVDAKIIKARKYYVIIFNGLSAIPMLLICTGVTYTPVSVCVSLICYSFCVNFLEAVVSSLSVEQARKDTKNGQEDIQSLKICFMGSSMTVGSVVATYLCEVKAPWVAFAITLGHAIFGTIQGFFLSDELETNEVANVVDTEVLLYELEMRKRAARNGEPEFEVKKPNCCQFFMIKMRILKQGLKARPVVKFFSFLIIQGFSMPQFFEFDYYFALDVLKIPLVTVNLQSLYVGWLVVLIPFIYQKYFIHRNYVVMFAIAQFVYVGAESINLLLATRYNLEVGIPDLLLFFLGGAIASVLERGFTFFPSMIMVSKMIPPGIESTMYSLSITVVVLNQFIIRAMMGVWVNDEFVGVRKGHMENFIYLKMICIVTSCIPLTYMFHMIPTLEETDELQQKYAKQKEEQQQLLDQSSRELEETNLSTGRQLQTQ